MNASSLRNPTAVLVAGSLILCIAIGVRACFGLFLQPMSLESAWGRETFSLAMAIQNLVWGLLGPFAGGIADRYGNGRVVAVCGLMYVLGLVAMAFTSTPLALHLGSGFLIGLALSGTTFATILAVIGHLLGGSRRIARQRDDPGEPETVRLTCGSRDRHGAPRKPIGTAPSLLVGAAKG